MAARATLSIIIPVLNEAASIVAALGALEPLRARGAEIVVVDGGSADDTAALAAPFADRIMTSARGRALADECRRGDRAAAMCWCSCMPTRGYHPTRIAIVIDGLAQLRGAPGAVSTSRSRGITRFCPSSRRS